PLVTKGRPDCQRTSLKVSVTEQRGMCAGGKSPLRVQSTRIFKLFRKFKNTHSVAKRHFRLAAKKASIRRCLLFLEVTPGFEPGNEGFADLCLTTWPRHQ